MKLVLILIIVIIFGIMCLYKVQENFTITYTTTTLPSNNYLSDLVDTILLNLNNTHNVNYIQGDIERVTNKKIEHGDNFSIIVFVYETKHKKTLKINLNVNVDKKNRVTLNNINLVNSPEVMDRSNLTGRDEKVYKTNLEKYYGVNQTKLEYDNADIVETKNKQLNRNKWIIQDEPTNLSSLGFKQFPCREMEHTWDNKGIMNIENQNKDCKGIYSGTKKQHLQPYFNPTIFVRNEDSYSWMFDLASDSASRPVGITGSRGTK